MSGDHAVKGVTLAKEEINAAGGINGRPIELVVEDTQSTNPGAIAAYNKTVQEDNVVAVIAPIRSTQIQSMDPMIREAKIVTLMGGTNTGLTEKGNPWLFRFRPPDKYAGQAMVEYLVGELKLTKIGILHDSDAFGTGGADVVEQTLKAKGLQAVRREKYTTGDKDYAAQLLAIKNAGAQALVVYGTNSEDDAIILRMRKDLAQDLVVMGSPSNVAQVTFDLGGEAVEGIYAVTDYLADANETSKKFAAAYEKTYGAKPDLYASWMYDALYALAYAIGKGGTEPDKMREAMFTLQDKESVEGTYNCAPNGDCAHTYYVVQAKGGQPVLIKTINFWQPTAPVTPTVAASQ
jgi:branched-chain amino acid transport system substrate-binding protein